MTFGFNSAALGGAGGLGLSANLRLMRRGGQQGPQTNQRCQPVCFLRPFFIGGDVNFSGSGKSLAGDFAQALLGAIGESADVIDTNPQFGLGVDLVDVLATGPAAAGVLKSHCRRRNTHTRENFLAVFSNCGR